MISFLKNPIRPKLLLVCLVICLFFSQHLKAQTLDFSSTFLTSPCTKDAVAKLTGFGDSTLAPGTIFYWRIGKAKPVISGKDYYVGYSDASTEIIYDVTLRIKTPSGYVDSITKKAFLNFTTLSDPKLYTSRTMLCRPGDYQSFIDSTSGVLSRKWYVNGVLQSSTSKVLNHQFLTAGNYTIKLEVTGYRGCVKSTSVVINAPASLNNDFKSILEEFPTDRNSLVATFEPILNNKLTVTKIVWKFPGGTPSSKTMTGANVKVGVNTVYSNVSTPQDVTMIVYTENGCIDTVLRKSLIQKYYSLPGTTDICGSEEGLIELLANNFDRQNFSWSSDFPVNAKSKPNNIYGLKFNKVGKPNYIRLNFKYKGSNANHEVTIYDVFTIKGPIAGGIKITNNKACTLPALLTFTPTGTLSSDDQMVWHFYDDQDNELTNSPVNTGTTKTCKFQFDVAGFYSVRLEITNKNGCSDMVYSKKSIKVGSVTPTVSFDRTSICAGETIIASTVLKPEEDSNDPYEHEWTITNNQDTDIISNYYSANPEITLDKLGTYTVKYSVGYAGCNNSLQFDSIITVNGLEADFSAKTISATCAPYSYALTSEIDAIMPTTATIASYKWEVIPATGATLTTPNAPTTNVIINKNGCYSIRLTLVSSDGCLKEIVKNNIFCVGTISSFNMDTVSCKNVNIVPINNSRFNPDYYKWSVSPAGSSNIFPNANAKNPSFSFYKDGCYTITLVTGKNSQLNCGDSITKKICIRTPKASFKASDSILFCQPQKVTFTNTSENGIKFTWVLTRIITDNNGNEISRVVMDSSIRNKKNNYEYTFTNNGEYDIKLIVGGGTGCNSIMNKKRFIKVVGPEAFFSLDKNTSCGNTTIIFKDLSKNAKSTFIQYGDLSPVTDIIGPHEYAFVDYDLDSNIYYPTIFAVNDDQCSSVDFYTEPVVLYRPPISKFVATQNTIGCNPMPVNFRNQTKYAKKYVWDFGDGTPLYETTDSTDFVHVYTKSGTFDVKLISYSNRGCVDTFVRRNYITVYPKPKVTITASDTVVCYYSNIQFDATSESAVPIVKWQWKFDDKNGIGDTANIKTPNYHFETAGTHNVTVVVTNANGCTDTAHFKIRNLSADPPPAPPINYVTVTPSGDVKIVYQRSENMDFIRYLLYRLENTTSTLVKSSNEITDVNYIDLAPAIDVNNNSYGYKLLIENNCHLYSKTDKIHRTIWLQAVQQTEITNLLTWTPYVGWNSNLKGYEIYRSEDKLGAFKKIATLDASANSYIDSPICNHTYNYYIAAINSEEPSFVSLSNRSSVVVNYTLQTTPLEVINATVLNDENVRVDWTAGIQKNIKNYVIDRYREGTGWREGYALTDTTYFIDTKADVHEQSYKYRVSTLDGCGNVSPLSDIGTSLHLSAVIVNDSRILSWNSYKNWIGGVKQYVLQIKDNSGLFVSLAVLNPSDTSYEDKSVHEGIYNGTCYRVLAIKNSSNGIHDTSMSNETCINLASRVWIPNAFSPNGDKRNETWGIIGISLYNQSSKDALKFDLKIYNRWGEMIWQTNDIEQQWDGTFKNRIAPEGLYIYELKASTLENKKINARGTFLLMR